MANPLLTFIRLIEVAGDGAPRFEIAFPIPAPEPGEGAVERPRSNYDELYGEQGECLTVSQREILYACGQFASEFSREVLTRSRNPVKLAFRPPIAAMVMSERAWTDELREWSDANFRSRRRPNVLKLTAFAPVYAATCELADEVNAAGGLVSVTEF